MTTKTNEELQEHLRITQQNLIEAESREEKLLHAFDAILFEKSSDEFNELINIIRKKDSLTAERIAEHCFIPF